MREAVRDRARVDLAGDDRIRRRQVRGRFEEIAGARVIGDGGIRIEERRGARRVGRACATELVEIRVPEARELAVRLQRARVGAARGDALDREIADRARLRPIARGIGGWLGLRAGEALAPTETLRR
jgi:hypothetical protein